MWINAYLQLSVILKIYLSLFVYYFITRLMGRYFILTLLFKTLRPQEQKCLGKVTHSLCYKKTQIHPNTSSTLNLIHLRRTIRRGLAIETRKSFKKIKILLNLSLFILSILFKHSKLGFYRQTIILIYLEKSKISRLYKMLSRLIGKVG